jgi:hypothetical protein
MLICLRETVTILQYTEMKVLTVGENWRIAYENEVRKSSHSNQWDEQHSQACSYLTACNCDI